MSVFTFKGVIHPYDGKELTKDKAIKELVPRGDMVYPVSQHIGAAAKPVVSPFKLIRTNTKSLVR